MASGGSSVFLRMHRGGGGGWSSIIIFIYMTKKISNLINVKVQLLCTELPPWVALAWPMGEGSIPVPDNVGTPGGPCHPTGHSSSHRPTR